MSVDVDLEIKPQSGVETTDRLSLIRFLESLGLQERESDVFYSRGGEEDVAVELSCSEHKVLGVSVGADGALWESATRLALAIAGHLGWKVFDNVRGDFIPHWELDAPVGLRPAMECVRSGLQRESVGWLLRRFAIHLVPTDLLWLSLLLYVPPCLQKLRTGF